LFVAVSVKSDVLAASRSLSSRAAQSLVLFMTSVLIAVLLVAPQPPAALGWELLAVGLASGVALFILLNGGAVRDQLGGSMWSLARRAAKPPPGHMPGWPTVSDRVYPSLLVASGPYVALDQHSAIPGHDEIVAMAPAAIYSCLVGDSYTQVAIDRELADMGATPDEVASTFAVMAAAMLVEACGSKAEASALAARWTRKISARSARQ
jgi:hypothetical protein